MPDWLSAILTNGAVWSAFILLVNTALFYFVPSFPRELWATINGFVIAILGALGISGVKVKVAQDRAWRAKHAYASAELIATQPQPLARASPPSSEETLGPDAASIHVGGNVKDSSVGAGGRDVRQG